ncbi:Hypothetical protein PHPALM_983, partial [Phytophthora palmivora]
MGLEELVPGNTKRAKATAVGSFVKFLKTEGVTEEYCFVSVMDKFGMYLAFALTTRLTALNRLVPGKTKRAEVTAVGTFVKFLKTEGVTEEY